ncbi:MAG: ABC transporter substrate-binding protein [Polyangiaceae bacterium]|nr:ABC transporter substrate-binding protein [Polyangiaceae bacterium]
MPIITRRQNLLALMAAAVSACSRAPAKEKPLRVVSISPNTTETMFAIGAGDALVGRSRYCDVPAEAKKLPAVGGFSDPNVEAIVALSPSLVIGGRGPAGPTLEQNLRAHGIETFFPETETIAAINTMITDLGKRVDRMAGAQRVVRDIEDKHKALRTKLEGKPRVRVLFAFDIAPVIAAGPGSFTDEVLREAGAENVVTKGGPYPTIGLEHLLTLDPDLLLDGASDMQATKSMRERVTDAPGWKELRAVKQGRIRAVGSDALRPGPRIGDGLWAVARAIHGDDFAP